MFYQCFLQKLLVLIYIEKNIIFYFIVHTLYSDASAPIVEVATGIYLEEHSICKECFKETTGTTDILS